VLTAAPRVSGCRIWKAIYWVLFRFLIWDMVSSVPAVSAGQATGKTLLHLPRPAVGSNSSSHGSGCSWETAVVRSCSRRAADAPAVQLTARAACSMPLHGRQQH
jgi:hypothetical protein